MLCFQYIASGVPIKLLYQGEGHNVTVELKNGEIYRGLLETAEETMNCQLKDGKYILFDETLTVTCELNFLH